MTNNASYNIITNNDCCIICLETDTISKVIPMYDYNKILCIRYWNCSCNGYFHKSCLDKWLLVDYSCPICRYRAKQIKLEHIANNIRIIIIYLLNIGHFVITIVNIYILINIFYIVLFD